MKRLALLGSTGSIGRQTLEVVRSFRNRLQIAGLAAGENVELLAKQIAEFNPGLVSLEDSSLRSRLPSGNYRLLSMEEIACHPDIDLVVIATSGRRGLGPTLAALTGRKNIALANKEALVMAGEIISARARQNDVKIMPIDSEHSAIWQCLQGESQNGDYVKNVARIILTASGGPFYHRPAEELATVTAEESLKHPTWQMGRKVTVDSATLINKGFEVIEAHWLFNIPYENIEVMIHPQSIIHSMVEFIDGSLKAQLSQHDMRLPIQYALSFPQRWINPHLPKLGWQQIKQLTFEPPDLKKFPCLRLAIEAGKKGGTYPAVLGAVDEVAVELFLSHHIRFTEIAELLERVLGQHHSIEHPSLEQIADADSWARQETHKVMAENLCQRY